MELYNNIKKYRLQLNLTQQQLADLTGYNDRSSIAKIEKGLVDISQSKLELFAKVLHVTAGELMGNTDADVPVSAPIYEVAAGPGRISSTPTGTMNIHLRDDQFLATVKGRSMEPTLFDGDTVVIDRQSVPDQDGQIVMVKVDGEENTLKRVQIGENGITLIADNPSVFPTKFYTAEQVKDLPVQIMGVVTKLIRDI